MSYTSSSSSSSPPNQLPLRQIPGNYGLPFLGPIKDRLDYLYIQGKDEFFKTRIQKHQSTVIRTNMPPGPFISQNSKVIALLDSASFPVLFDMSKVEKYNVLDGTFFPSVSFTGGHRMCAYLDSSEQNHTTLKAFFFSILASKHKDFIPLFRSYLNQLFKDTEDQMSSKNKVDFTSLLSSMSFNFMFHLLTEKDPLDTSLGSRGPTHSNLWLAFQLAPLATLGLPKIFMFLEDIMLRTFSFPFFFVKSDYKKLYDAFYHNSASVLDRAESLGIEREEACHNLVFVAVFNAYGGLKVFLPSLIKWVARGGQKLHHKLVEEIRAVVKEENGEVSLRALDKMTLTNSVVYEAFRIEPPIAFQYAKAREDLIVQSHDAAFKIKKGEMIFGYQPFATKDPKVFEDPEEFVSDRFMGVEGEKLLKYVYWSNGREIDEPTAENKQCPGKNLVVLLSRLLLVELFLRYDTFTADSKESDVAGSSVTLTSLVKATTGC